MIKLFTIIPAVASAFVVFACAAGANDNQRNILSQEDIAAFKTEMPGSVQAETLKFSASFRQVTQMAERDRRRHAEAGTIPFHITADFVAERVANGRTLRQRQRGVVRMYVQDADGKVVASQSMQVERMCPT
jgi:hypothetical protein